MSSLISISLVWLLFMLANMVGAACCVTNVSNAVELQVNRNNVPNVVRLIYALLLSCGRAWTWVQMVENGLGPGAHGYLALESYLKNKLLLH